MSSNRNIGHPNNTGGPAGAVKSTIPEEQLWENLKISNDFMFAKVMRNAELCKGLLRRLLNMDIGHIEYLQEQKTIDISKDSKSVRLDVYLRDGKYQSGSQKCFEVYRQQFCGG